ncbi:MAG: PilC/PilY family type IV pilus protein, partial [Thermoanaerobaculia bacterium]|nr:PilC/PilY family type IV pilus protein [Thermoanaerobaculia bacterium]
MRPSRPATGRTVPKLALLIGILLVVAGAPQESFSDDTFLFRVQSGKPYLYIFFDTSSSMNLSAELGGAAVDANGDDPRSTFYQAKSAMYEVFNRAFQQSGDFIHYGFATYNQDGLRVRGKHWLYRVKASTDSDAKTVDIAGTPYPDVGELMVFGAHLPVEASPDPTVLPISQPGVLGSCEQPVDFATARAAINRFPKLHPLDTEEPFGFLDDMAPTTIWLTAGGILYRLEVQEHTQSGKFLLNNNPLKVDFVLTEFVDCATINKTSKAVVHFDLVQTFLMHDQLGADNVSDITEEGDLGSGTREPERQGGLWHYQDYTARAVCGDDAHPFTGQGFEGNYDGGTPPAGIASPSPDFPDVDPFQTGSLTEERLNLKFATTLNSGPACLVDFQEEARTLDSGDFLPSHWERTNREEFFRRLAPNWTSGKDIGQLDFSIASYFKDVPNAEGFLELRDPTQRPLMAFGDSPIGEALVDWRCFYLGSDQPGGKCRNSEQPFGRGWDFVAPQCDLEWGCRRPFLIIITDGENNCRGENPAADTANLRRNRVQAWVINFGGPDAKDLRRLAQNTGGQYIEVANRDQLLGALENLLGEIIEQTRAFASAVVPTVQAEEADKIFVSNFKPLNQEPVWPGNVQAFLKPVPIDGDGKPDTSIQCGSGPGQAPESECFLWNSGQEMLGQVQALNVQFGQMTSQRRVYYSRLTDSGDWPNTRRFVEPTSSSDPDAVRYDLWRGLGLIPEDTLDGSLTETEENTHEATANAVIAQMMAMKVDDNDTPDDTSDDSNYILGDVFHSDPLVLGSPSNTKYFALNLNDDGSACENGNPSYRCFFRKHQNRRKILMVGSNDGMAHAFDAGIFRTTGDFADRFDRGSGKEVFAFMPRTVMPTVKSLYGDGLNRDWTVDGSIVGFDAFIDPLADGALFPDPGDRQWRTVIFGGLRRGGRGYYALDVTQPDPYNADDEPTNVNGYVPACAVPGTADCGPVAYPSQLWEFTDSWLAPATATQAEREISFDKDQDGIEDLAETWSVPNLGLMKVCNGTSCDETAENNDVEDRFVAIFGGGLDKTSATGNWLYIVDVETGQTLYKEQLLDVDNSSGGAAVAEPAAVDSDGDGYLDRIYVGTLEGFLYRVDLRGPNGEIPALASTFDFVEFSPGIFLGIG